MASGFRRYIPTREQIHNNRWLRWLGPSLLHPKLWHFSRRGVAIGVAAGVFFGLLIPFAQIPVAAGAAILMRGNVPAAIASTLITNPVTFAPIYVLAHHVGASLLGETHAVMPDPEQIHETPAEPNQSWWRDLASRVFDLGKPLLLGLLVFAVGAGVLTYVVIMLAWRVQVIWSRRRRKKKWLQYAAKMQHDQAKNSDDSAS